MPYETIEMPDLPDLGVNPPSTQPAGDRERQTRKKTARGEPIRLILCDLNPLVLDAWRAVFAGCRQVEIQQVRAADAPADGYVAYVKLPDTEETEKSRAGPATQADSPKHIPSAAAPLEMRRSQAAGISVGAAKVGEHFVIHLAARPGDPLGGYGVTTYRITRAVLDAIAELDEEYPDAIRSVAVPDLRLPGKQVDALDAAHQMRRAIDDFFRPP